MSSPSGGSTSLLLGGKEVRGLSLTRPWPFAFVTRPSREGVAPKRVENRSRRPPAALVGHYLALHAAQSWDEGAREFIARAAGVIVPGKNESPHSHLFAVCRLAGYVERATDLPLDAWQRLWFFGPYGWLLEEFVELRRPVACKGGQGLWGFGKRRAEFDALIEAYATSKV